eukprot:scaffold803_cov310-Pinguiococcus_pyrenoidosus.AAC.124
MRVPAVQRIRAFPAKEVRGIRQGGPRNPPSAMLTAADLCTAAKRGDTKQVALLLDGGADVNAPQDGWTPLAQAAINGHADTVAVLLERGAEANKANDSGHTALHFAADKDENVVALLLDSGADVNKVSRDGWTPLRYAAVRGHARAATLLLDRGAKLDEAGIAGIPLLNHVVYYPQVARLLLDRGVDVNAIDGNGDTALCCAAREGCKATVELLLDRGAAMDQANHRGETPVIAAAEKGHAEIGRILLNHGADAAHLDDVVLRVVDHHPSVFGLASERLRDDREDVLRRVAHEKDGPRSYIHDPLRGSGKLLQYVSDNLRDDKQVVLKALESCPFMLEFASIRLRWDVEVVSAAAKRHAPVVQFAPDDKQLILAVVKRVPQAFQHISKRLRSDGDCGHQLPAGAGLRWRRKCKCGMASREWCVGGAVKCVGVRCECEVSEQFRRGERIVDK